MPAPREVMMSGPILAGLIAKKERQAEKAALAVRVQQAMRKLKK